MADLLGPVMRRADAEVVHRHAPWASKKNKAFFRWVGGWTEKWSVFRLGGWQGVLQEACGDLTCKLRTGLFPASRALAWHCHVGLLT